jgi:hypothetical protein
MACLRQKSTVNFRATKVNAGKLKYKYLNRPWSTLAVNVLSDVGSSQLPTPHLSTLHISTVSTPITNQECNKRQNSRQNTSENCWEWTQAKRGAAAARQTGGRQNVFVLSLTWLVFSSKQIQLH